MIHAIFWLILYAALHNPLSIDVQETLTIDSLGACQGVDFQHGALYLYGDREVGVIRKYTLHSDDLAYSGEEYQLTRHGENVINHPTGLAVRPEGAFIGNTIRLNREGTNWKALIYHIDWEGLMRDHNLDDHVLNVVEDDACIQGTRPEYVRLGDAWYLATADYGDRQNEVRLYDPERLKTASRTSDEGVLVDKFSCGPWVQNLHWIDEQEILVLIQNQEEGRKWRLTFLDFKQSLTEGEAAVIQVVDIDRHDELEGFTLTDNPGEAIAVSAHRKDNVSIVNVRW
jgi:hypothetical protein